MLFKIKGMKAAADAMADVVDTGGVPRAVSLDALASDQMHSSVPLQYSIVITGFANSHFTGGPEALAQLALAFHTLHPTSTYFGGQRRAPHEVFATEYPNIMAIRPLRLPRFFQLFAAFYLGSFHAQPPNNVSTRFRPRFLFCFVNNLRRPHHRAAARRVHLCSIPP